MRLRAGTRLRPMAERVRGMTAAAAWNPGRLPGTPREWLAGPDWCFTDGSAAFTAASSQFLSVASNATLQVGGGQSWWVSAWVNRDGTAATHTVVSKDDLTNREYGIYLNSGGNTLTFEAQGAARISSTPISAAGNWFHVFAWYDSTDQRCRVKIDNGSTVTSGGTTAITSGAAQFRIGGRDIAGSILPMNGRVATVGFGKVASISSVADTIAARTYASGNGIVYADTTSAERTAWGLVSWWDLVRSGNFTDSHGTNNLTNNNGVGFGAGLPRAGAGDTDPVSAWVDRWQGTLWSEADPLKRLVLRDLGGGRWVLRSDGVNDGIGHGPAMTGARTIAMSYTQTVGASGTRILQAASGVDSGVSPRRASGGNVTVGGTTVRGTVFADDSSPHVYSKQRSGAGPWRVWSDGVSLTVTDQTANFGSLGVGAFTGAGAAETWTGDIYSIVDTNADISDADRAALTTYLSRLYGGSL